MSILIARAAVRGFSEERSLVSSKRNPKAKRITGISEAEETSRKCSIYPGNEKSLNRKDKHNAIKGGKVIKLLKLNLPIVIKRPTVITRIKEPSWSKIIAYVSPFSPNSA